MPAPVYRGTAFAPNTDLYAIDHANRVVERHVFDRSEDSYRLSSTKTFRGKPLAITYMSVKTGFDFDGVVITLDTRNIRFVSCPYLEVRRTVYSYGRCTAITAVPNTQSLLVVNSETASIDVINIYGVPMKRFDLPDILNPEPGLMGPAASVALSTLGDREVVTVASDTGLYVMTVDIDKTKTLILTPRQTLRKTENFCPISVASLKNLLFVANGSEDEPKIHRYSLSLRDKPPETVVLTESGEMSESDPLSICILQLDEDNFRLGGSRRHDNARGMDLLFHKNFGPEEN